MQLCKEIERLIVAEGVNIFLFGSKSRFNSLCLEAVTLLKEKYPHISRIYVRAEFPNISEHYQAYLMEHYEDTYYPKELLRAGRAVYVERNRSMIDDSRFCIVYYDEALLPSTRKSGTKIALDYAIAHKKEIVIFPKR